MSLESQTIKQFQMEGEEDSIKPAENIWPLTIVADRYRGSYSGSKYLAFNEYPDELPFEPFADDVTCMEFWHYRDDSAEQALIIGKGSTPNEALESLQKQSHLLEQLKK